MRLTIPAFRWSMGLSGYRAYHLCESSRPPREDQKKCWFWQRNAKPIFCSTIKKITAGVALSELIDILIKNTIVYAIVDYCHGSLVLFKLVVRKQLLHATRSHIDRHDLIPSVSVLTKVGVFLFVLISAKDFCRRRDEEREWLMTSLTQWPIQRPGNNQNTQKEFIVRRCQFLKPTDYPGRSAADEIRRITIDAYQVSLCLLGYCVLLRYTKPPNESIGAPADYIGFKRNLSLSLQIDKNELINSQWVNSNSM